MLIGLGDCIYIENAGASHEDGIIDPTKQWKGQVLDVRALDQNHVFVLVAFLLDPHDLPDGPAEHHGYNELVASNHLDIIDGMAVNGKVELSHWDDANDELPLPSPVEDEFFWRQAYDRHTNTLSSLRTICVCKIPQNPYRRVVQCDNCKEWLHFECVEKDAEKRATPQEVDESPSSKGEEVKLSIPPGGAPKLIFKSLGPKRRSSSEREESVRCLVCKEIVN